MNKINIMPATMRRQEESQVALDKDEKDKGENGCNTLAVISATVSCRHFWNQTYLR